MPKAKSRKPLRQGDVLLQPVDALPAGCTPVPLDHGDVILAYGEVTHHAHRIANVASIGPQAADEIAQAAIARAKARLWQTAAGDRYLEVVEPVSLTHEEHSTIALAPGVYEVPVQIEWTAEHGARQVAD